MLGRSWLIFRRSGLQGLKTSYGILLRGEGPPRMTDAGTLDRKHYSEWVKRYDTLTDGHRAAMRRRIASMSSPPLISVLMPAYDTDATWLREAIESVRRQIYPHWELCIADDASPTEAARDVMREYAARDPRIKVVPAAERAHRGRLEHARSSWPAGAWVALMDHDDLLPARLVLARRRRDRPVSRGATDLLGRGQDRHAEGMRCAPYFKRDWNIDLFLVTEHVLVIWAPIGTGLWSRGGRLSGSASRARRTTTSSCAAWSASPMTQSASHLHGCSITGGCIAGSTAQPREAEAVAQQARRASAATSTSDARGVTGDGRATPECAGMVRVRYGLPEPPPLSQLIIPTRERRPAGAPVHREHSSQDRPTRATRSCWSTTASDDPAALAYFRQLDEQARHSSDPGRSALQLSRRINNAAVELAEGELVGLINNDIEVISPRLARRDGEPLRSQPGVGAVGARLLVPNRHLQHGGVILGIGGVAGHCAQAGSRRATGGYCSRAALIQKVSAV